MISGLIEDSLHPHIFQVKWHDLWQDIDVVLSDDEESAIGTRLLQGCIMTMDFIQNTLTIDKPT